MDQQIIGENSGSITAKNLPANATIIGLSKGALDSQENFDTREIDVSGTPAPTGAALVTSCTLGEERATAKQYLRKEKKDRRYGRRLTLAQPKVVDLYRILNRQMGIR